MFFIAVFMPSVCVAFMGFFKSVFFFFLQDEEEEIAQLDSGVIEK